jgi:7,8-dihydropterin-6-yl-methyl-4-(beta-D-ribofuranosyl)aminobenzene 5'-phosphate synthase
MCLEERAKIENIDFVIASHSHNDHTGGMLKFFEKNNKAKLYISKNANQKLFFRVMCFKENVSTPQEIFTNYNERISFVDSFMEIDENISIVSGFERKYPLPKTNDRLLSFKNKAYVQDNFNHEVAVVINNNGKLIIISGCSHSGVDNVIEEVMKHFPGYPIQIVIGGFHLMSFILPKYLGEKKKNIVELGERLLKYNIEKTYTCHCTGDRAFHILKGVMGDKIDNFNTGDELEF